MHKSSPREIRTQVLRCLEAGLVPLVRSSPGCGKSSIFRDIAASNNLEFVDIRLSMQQPEDFMGIPQFSKEKNKAHFVPFGDLFPLDGDPLPEGKDGWLILFDEFPDAPRQVQAAAYKIILDRMVGMHHIHPNAVMAAAGNLATDKALAGVLSTAMISRLVHLEMEVNFGNWFEDVASVQEYDPRIIAYLNNYPQHLMDFDPEKAGRTFCSPRTWEFVNRLIQGRELEPTDRNLLAGTISPEVALAFVRFTEVFNEIPSLKDIEANPATIKLESSTALTWALVSMLMSNANQQNLPAFVTYISRLNMSFQVLFLKYLVNAKPKLMQEPSASKLQLDLGRAISI